MHLLIFLHPDDRIHDADQVDSIVSAEIPDPELHPLLYETVTTCMLHGPCGDERPNAPCMVNGQCSKRYPKSLGNIPFMAKMDIQSMQGLTMDTGWRRMASHMTTDMLFLTTDISLPNTTVTSMWRSVHPLNLSSTSTSTSSKAMTVPLQSFEMIRTAMRSRSIWMHIILDQ
jgi:hypothetical protein